MLPCGSGPSDATLQPLHAFTQHLASLRRPLEARTTDSTHAADDNSSDDGNACAHVRAATHNAGGASMHLEKDACKEAKAQVTRSRPALMGSGAIDSVSECPVLQGDSTSSPSEKSPSDMASPLATGSTQVQDIEAALTSSTQADERSEWQAPSADACFTEPQQMPEQCFPHR
jgi:hypothetical protein